MLSRTRKLWLVGVVAVGGCRQRVHAAPSPAAVGPAEPPAAVRELERLERAFHRARLEKDTAALARQLPLDYVHVYSTPGAQVTRERFIRGIGAPGLLYTAVAVDSVGVRLFGTAALVTCVVTERGSAGGEAIRGPEGEEDYRFRSVRMYVWRSGAWQPVYGQGTTIHRH
jgi:uncharacterized protein DUF4440